MTSADITRALALFHWTHRREVCVPNCHFAGQEADLLVLRPSGWLEEVEIKISVSDFRKDFTHKPNKHRRLSLGNPKRRSCHSWARAEDRGVFDSGNPSHVPTSRFGGGDGMVTSFNDYTTLSPHLIRKFWFAVPADLQPKVETEIPAHAGLLVMHAHPSSIRCEVVKPAPLLNARKLTDAEQFKLARLACVRYWSDRIRDKSVTLWD